MSRYAEGTTVAIEQSQVDIRKLLKKNQAEQIVIGESNEGGTVGFTLSGRMYRFAVDYPDPSEKRFTHHGRGYRLPTEQAKNRFEAEKRRKWRVLLIQLKIKFELVEGEAATLEQEFLSYIMLPDGSTVGQVTESAIEYAYQTGKMPELMPGLHALPGRSDDQ
jgi:hypothetical protein